LERPQLRVVLDPLPMPPLAPQTGRVDEHERPPVVLEDGVDRVARRSGDLGDDHALPSEQGVDEARLADVRPAEDRDTDRLLADLEPTAPSYTGKLLDHVVEQVAGAVPVQAGDRDRVAEPEPVQVER